MTNQAPTEIKLINGFVLNGIDSGDTSGVSVSGAGDVNGDGFDDLLIGANGTEESYVVFGKGSGFAASIDLDSLDGSNGFVLNSIDHFYYSGVSVSGAGDVNGDGFDDLLIGVPSASPNGNSRAGESYVVFGKGSGFAASIDLDSLDGSNGFVLNGIDSSDGSGDSVSSAGDVNGDGFDDLLIGANGTEESYVVFGKGSSFTASIDLDSLDGSNGFVLNNGIDHFYYSGGSVSGAGDVNGDGFDDLIIDVNGTEESYVVFGKGSGFAASIDLDSLDGSNGFVLNGSDYSGGSVSSAGDVNGDGFDDLLIGAQSADPNGNRYAGESYVVFGKSGGFADSIDLDSLDGSNGFVLNGIDSYDFSGRSVSSAGDVNGDGFDDLLIGAPYADPNVNISAGESYVVFGKSGGFAASIDLDSLDGGNGFVLNGIDNGDESGKSVSGAGDVNGDGFDDLLIGAPSAEPNGNRYAGESYVIFGRSSFSSSIELANLDTANVVDENSPNGTVIGKLNTDDPDAGDTHTYTLIDDAGGRFAINGNDQLIVADGSLLDCEVDASHTIEVQTTDSGGLSFSKTFKVLVNNKPEVGNDRPSNINFINGNSFILNGIDSGDESGRSVSSAGDVNGDGFDDLIIGAPFADPNGIDRAGESYVVFGKSGGFAASIDLDSLNGSNGFVLNGIDRSDRSGNSVSGAGDVNGDGFDDLIIGADSASPYAEESYVVFGKGSGFAASIDLDSLDGSNGFVLNSIDSYYGFMSMSVSSAGDVNGDGFDDLLIGAPSVDPNGNTNAGESYVVFGKSGGFAASFDLDSLDGSNGFVLNGIDSGDGSGGSVSSAGDVNGDGFDDLIIGAPFADPNGNTDAGESYVVFGKDGGFAAGIDLDSLDGSNGFVLNGIDDGDRSGTSVSGAGDVNGDGFDDLIIDKPSNFYSGVRAGESYVVFGKSGGFAASFDLDSLNGSNGFVLNGIDFPPRSGRSVSGAGDVNGDGFDDLLIGEPYADPNGNSSAGESYVVFGKGGGFAASIDLDSLDGSNGFVLNGIDNGDESGKSVSSAGDVNGDGFDDLLIGATGADPNGIDRAGESYLVFGRSSFSSSIELSNNTANVNENSPNGTIIALLNTDDFDAGDTHTYTLIDDASGRFGINGNNELIVADGSLLDFEVDTSHTIEVETTDSGGLSFTQTLTINVLDQDEGVDTFGPDFNLDGKRDLVWRNQVTGRNAVWYMDGNTRTGFDDLPKVSNTDWQIVGAGDANGDQKTDLYWRNQATGRNVLWYMDGTTRTDHDELLSVNNPNWQVVGIGDADNDSLVDDLYWRNQVTGQNAFWYMDGTTVTDSHYLQKVTDANWEIVSIGDGDNDGVVDDLYWRNQATGRNVVWYMDGDTRTGFAEVPKVANLDWDIVGTGDTNEDQKTDIYWRNQAIGSNAVWYMDGVNRTGVDNLPSVTNTDWEIVA